MTYTEADFWAEQFLDDDETWHVGQWRWLKTTYRGEMPTLPVIWDEEDYAYEEEEEEDEE